VIAVAVRWYLRYGLSYRDVEKLLAERGIEVDHVTVYRWVQTFTCEFIDSARPSRHATGERWFVDETYVKVAGRWTYLYRAVDQHGQVIDVLVSERRDGAAARAFFIRALKSGPSPVEVTTDRAPVYPRVIDELVPAARHVLEQYATTAWKLITADSRLGFGRCVAWRGVAWRGVAWRGVAWREDDALIADRRSWPCVRAEPAPRPLRDHCRRARP
jgi:transposase-like protein